MVLNYVNLIKIYFRKQYENHPFFVIKTSLTYILRNETNFKLSLGQKF